MVLTNRKSAPELKTGLRSRFDFVLSSLAPKLMFSFVSFIGSSGLGLILKSERTLVQVECQLGTDPCLFPYACSAQDDLHLERFSSNFPHLLNYSHDCMTHIPS